MAKLRAVLDSVDDLPEGQSGLYVEGQGDYEGRYVLDVEEVDGLGLANAAKVLKARDQEKNAAKRLRGEAEKAKRELEAAMEQLEELKSSSGQPADVDKIRERLEKDAAARIEAIKAEMAEQLQSVSGERDRYRTDYETTRLETELDRALELDGIEPVSRPGVKALLKQFARWEDTDDGGRELRFMDLDGETPLHVTQGGMPRAGGGRDLAMKLAKTEDYAGMFRGLAPSGGNAARDRVATNRAGGMGGPKPYHVQPGEMRDRGRYQQLQKQAEAGEIALVFPGAEG